MTVIYDFYETPVPDGQEKKGELHVRVLPRQTVNSEELAKTIHQRSTFMESEVGAVINLLRNLIVEKLKDGDRVHLDGLGFFQMTATCPPVRSEKEIRAESAKFKSVSFRPEKDLKRELYASTHFVRVDIKNHSKDTSLAEIDAILTDYFKNNNYITRADFERICRLTKTTANRRLKTLVDDGHLRKEGIYHFPIYTPGPGYYGNL